MARDQCKCPGCTDEPDTGRFCSDRCQVKYDKLKDDAREARLADEGQPPAEKPVSDREFRRMVL